ncbi:FAD-binding protein [Desulfovibrio cuneatus]|uniref:FAD-binding protein n=1 Tax=Desulfovibrio cuneatus TaxID=159728 RepID=UPI0003FE19A6|nr:FAD-binding protein [Desulfovibrio cuneatus]
MAKSTSSSGAPAVIVLGGGLAGITAALAARSAGAAVSMLSLGPVGRSGNTLVAGGISSATNDVENPPELFLHDIMQSGQGVGNSSLARVLAEESFPALQRMEEFGVVFAREGGKLLRRLPPGHSVPRNIPTDWAGVAFAMRGITFVRPLAEHLAVEGVAVHNGFCALRLLCTEGRVTGVLVVERKSGKCFSVRADAVVLATGGYAGLFWRTNNVSDSYGDGVALALGAGCTVRDMEMVQFHPCMMFTPVKLPVLDSLFGAGALLRNSTGEAFMPRYSKTGNMATRDVMARAIFQEVAAGRGVNGGVYVDCGKVPHAALEGQFSLFGQVLAKHGLCLGKDMLVAGPCAHYSLGGVVIDPQGRTTVAGLYAAGEVCGGVHGANRLAGGSLMDACVFGWRAGRAAVEDMAGAATRSDSVFTSFSNCIDATSDALFQVKEWTRQLRTLMWEQVSVVRTGKGLQAALATLHELEGAAKVLWASVAREKFLHKCMVASCVVRSALARQESRGAHYRADFPLLQEEYTGHTRCRFVEGLVSVQFQAEGMGL